MTLALCSMDSLSFAEETWSQCGFLKNNRHCYSLLIPFVFQEKGKITNYTPWVEGHQAHKVGCIWRLCFQSTISHSCYALRVVYRGHSPNSRFAYEFLKLYKYIDIKEFRQMDWKSVISDALPNQAIIKLGHPVFVARQPLPNIPHRKRCETFHLPPSSVTAFLIFFALLLSYK